MDVHLSSAFLSTLATALPANGFVGTSVLVVGDIILDKYVIGDVERISPEAPVPVLSVRAERAVPGGSANVALNVAGLNARAFLAGVVGQDTAGERLLGLMDQSPVDTAAVVIDLSRPTTCKTRVICQNHQIVRLDEEVCDDISSQISRRLFNSVLSLLDREDIDAVVLSDYAKGVLPIELIRSLIQACRRRKVPIFVDPKRRDYMPYSGATCLTPNLREFKTALASMAVSAGEMMVDGSLLRDRLGCEALLITQGAHGMTLISANHSHHIPAIAEEVFDVSGAGDTVIACLSTAAAKHDLLTAVQVANAAAGIVVRRFGTSPIDWESLYQLVCGGASGHANRNASAVQGFPSIFQPASNG
jgi:D-beta-D-heptose 7-phosphate kinase / D-beta-D-heptose 1-phosphate adenosyltransferase